MIFSFDFGAVCNKSLKGSPLEMQIVILQIHPNRNPELVAMKPPFALHLTLQPEIDSCWLSMPTHN